VPEPAPAPAALAPAIQPAEPPAPFGPRPVARRDLVRVLDRGPQDLLASIEEDPVVEGGRFRGWVFRGWRDDRFASAGLQAGDVIQRVNGKPIERPEQLIEVWEELRRAPALVIEGTRAGRVLELRYPIQD
jgi:general secretion pathway protein C